MGIVILWNFGDILKKVTLCFAFLSAIVITSAITFLITYEEMSVGGRFSDFGIKTQAINQILDTYYINDYDQQTIEDLAISAMVAGTGDRWGYYIPASQYTSYEESVSNEYVGIGVTILSDEEVTDGFLVTTTTQDGPAHLAGVLVGDVLVAVEGEDAMELGLTEVVARVRGEAGTDITITFRRDQELLDITMTRMAMEEAVATYALMDNQVALITISNFDAKSAQQTLTAIDQAVADEAVAIVFDLRNNPGGYKDEMVQVLDRLLPEGELFHTVDYDGFEEIDTSDADFLDLPMAVLVNENSYSAAEFFAAALQEYEAATVVGMQTSGKGDFQVTIPLKDGSGVHLSIGKYYTPNGRSLTDVGVTPDVVVAYEVVEGVEYPQNDPQLTTALQIFADFP